MAVRSKIISEYKEIPALKRYEILERMNQVEGNNTLRDKALIAFLYLTGARISEVVKFKKQKDGTANELTGQPIQLKQLDFNDRFILVMGVRCLKRGREVRRDIIIPLNPKEKDFINTIYTYLRSTESTTETHLFPITRQMAYLILAKVKLFPHWLRHSRMTHLIQDYGMGVQHLQQFAGRKTLPEEYIHLDISDIKAKMGV